MLTGAIFGTCGHELSTKWFDSGKGEICIKDIDREGIDCLSYLVVCAKCLGWYQVENLIVRKDKWHKT